MISVGGSIPQFATEVTLNPASCAANNTNDQTFTVSGLTTDMQVVVTAASLEAGLVIGQAVVSAANTLKIRFGNLTAAPIDPASQTFKVVAF